MSFNFPAHFLWGAATAGHQVEGGNWNSDWWSWEHVPNTPCIEPSGDACDHYHRYAEDIAMLSKIGFNAYRFSLEWSRIEPEDGEFSLAALNHYRHMCKACKDKGIEPVVTFSHFSLPRWFAASGGWTWKEAPQRFSRYCGLATSHLDKYLNRVATLNEPNVLLFLGYHLGIFPPGSKDENKYNQARGGMIEAHHAARDIIRKTASNIRICLTLGLHEWTVMKGGEKRLERDIQRWESGFLSRDIVGNDDFLGVQAYTRILVGPEETPPLDNPESGETQFETLCGFTPFPEGTRRTQTGFEFRPKALESVVRRCAALTDLPILVTENGVATGDDKERIEYISGSLDGLRHCIEDGINVEGYIYWSFMDNFEWSFGYQPQYGLIAVDRVTQERSIKPSARHLGNIARNNVLPD